MSDKLPILENEGDPVSIDIERAVDGYSYVYVNGIKGQSFKKIQAAIGHLIENNFRETVRWIVKGDPTSVVKEISKILQQNGWSVKEAGQA